MNALNVVLTRLLADRKGAEALADRAPEAIRIVETRGSPPTGYLLRFGCRTMTALGANGPEFTTTSLVRIDLPDGYPLRKPTVRLMTPVVNPHIFENQTVCIGSAWSAAEPLDQFIGRIWRIMVWDPLVLDPHSVANGAAMAWAKANMNLLPLDRTDPGEQRPTAAVEPARPKISWR